MRRLLRDESGMSLVELLVVCLVLGVIMAVVSNMFVSGLRASTTSDARLTSQEAVRTAFDRLEYQTRCADSATILSSGGGVHLHLADWCANATGDVSWCVNGSSLVYAAAADCSGSTTAFVGNVTSAEPFCLQTVTDALPQLYVSLAVDASAQAGTATAATDAITLRNASPASSTSASCT